MGRVRFGPGLLLLLIVPPSFAVYEIPSYTQARPAVRSIALRLPQTAKLGQPLEVSFEIALDQPIPENRNLYLHLLKDNMVFDVQVIHPEPGTGAWQVGKPTVVGPCSVTLPTDISPGEYEAKAGIYKEKAFAKGRIRLNGTSTRDKPMVVTTGSFADKYGVPHYWHVNKAHTLFWDGEPFIPAGGMFIYDRDWNLVKAQLDLLKSYGVMNIYLHLGVNQPYVWKEYSDDDYRFFQQTVDYLDDNGFTYGIEFQALEAKGPGYSYPGGGARVDHVKTSGTVRAEEKGVRSAMFLVHDNATGKVVQTGDARVIDGKFVEADVVVPKEGDYRVVFATDREGPDGYVMYYWDDKYENYVKKIRDHYSKVKLGPGFRFLADPLWNEMNNNHSFIPSAPVFAEQFTQWLEERYVTVGKLNDAWKPVGAKWPTFSAAGSTVSMERIDDKTSGKLMQYSYSRSAKRFYAMEACTSRFNYDVREFIGRSLLYYCNDVADVFKGMNDVPVIYKVFSDIDWWHINDTGLASGHDGLGMESYGNGEPMLLFMAAHVFGMCEQAAKTTWVIVTETGEGNHQDASLPRNKSIGYTDRLGTMYANYNALISGGAKGIYQFNMVGGKGMQEPWSDNLSRDPRQLEWIATYDRILANAPKLVDYKPAVYFRYPAHFNPCSMELYSEPCGDFYNMGGWWWREPIERSQNGLWILPAISLRADTPMYIVNLESMPASARFAAELTEAIKCGKRITMIGFRKDIGAIPAVDSYYTPEFAINEHGREFQVLKPTPTSRIVNKTASGQVWNLTDGNVQINSEEVFGRHGYQPQNLVTGSEMAIDPYLGVFDDLLGVQLLDLGPDLAGFTYRDKGVPVTVVSATTREVTLSAQVDGDTKLTYADGTPAGVRQNRTVTAALKPVDKTLVRARYDWGPEGIMVDSLKATETVTIKGNDAARAWMPSVVDQAMQDARNGASKLPAKEREALDRQLSPILVRSDLDTQGFVGATREAEESFYSATTPYIWIEGESPISHNYNYSRLGGIPTLSGNAYLGLETAVTPPTDTGWYASYEFEAAKPGSYQLWLRENYLSFSSPCSYRIDNREWVEVPNTLVPHDTQVVALYNAVEDSRQIFGWYHYGAVTVTAGKHTITLRVNQPRPKGTVLTMADDRPYAKLIDCILLTQRGFVPDGKRRPHYLLDAVQPVMVNILPDPSVEFDSDGDSKCDGWTPSEEKGLEWTKPGWGNVKVDGLFDINLNLKEAYSEMRALKIAAGERERTWSTGRLPLGTAPSLQAGGWLRTVDAASAFMRVVWLDKAGKTLSSRILTPAAASVDWQEINEELEAPAGAAFAVFECGVEPGSKGTAWFDDMVLAKKAGGSGR